MKKLSIITINYNNATGLKKTLDSVAAQTCNDFEHIIVDGASTDGSVDVIREYEQKVTSNLSHLTSRLIWLSEPDTGIYNAMNKGVRLAKGEYTLMLNSGDYLVNENVIMMILPFLDGTDIIQGNILSMIDGKTIINRGYGKSDISFIDAIGGHFLHQASFCKRALYDKYGYFDESYRINGDTVFYAKCLALGNATFRYMDGNIAFFDTTGISMDSEGKWSRLRKEEDERYAQLFSCRMWNLHKYEEKKIKLYDKLHAHRWSWNLTMMIAHLCNWLYRDR